MSLVILHDTRLHGIPEAGLGRVITVNAQTPLATGLSRVAQAAVFPVTELAIACHGYMSHEYNQMSNLDARGGQGLQLCREDLLVSNVSQTRVLRNVFDRIWIMACGPAGTIVHSSRPFCREMAHYTNTQVIASDTAQRYHPGIYDHAAQVSRYVLRFGEWEGSVFRFTPDGNIESFNTSETPLP